MTSCLLSGSAVFYSSSRLYFVLFSYRLKQNYFQAISELRPFGIRVTNHYHHSQFIIKVLIKELPHIGILIVNKVLN